MLECALRNLCQTPRVRLQSQHFLQLNPLLNWRTLLQHQTGELLCNMVMLQDDLHIATDCDSDLSLLVSFGKAQVQGELEVKGEVM